MYTLSIHPGQFEEKLKESTEKFNKENVLDRIWKLDHTVWDTSETEITNRLGWLTAPAKYSEKTEELAAFASEVKDSGITDVILLGMGGSSLTPEVFSRTFGSATGYPRLQVLDSTDPGTVLARQESITPETTLFIVATKSGGTVETLSFFKYFYNWIASKIGSENAGAHFIAITDPGSKLETLATDFKFRKTFINDPNIGGRYSALSLFGLVPAALIGVELKVLLDNAIAEQKLDSATRIGLLMAEAAKAGKDKLTFIASDSLSSFGDWAEQLIAESTGKIGEGILPVVEETIAEPENYEDDRIFVYLKLSGENSTDGDIQTLRENGHPIIQIDLPNKNLLGAQFFLWEMATAIASWRLKIHPFNQPNVESAKILGREVVTTYQESGTLPTGEIQIFSNDTLKEFLSQTTPGDYVSIHGYIPHNQKNTQQLQKLQVNIRDKYKIATTVGFGPRFLHSTGQLHKGDSGNGLFIQFIGKPSSDLDIPDEAGKDASTMSFGVLMRAQALGDAAALRNEGRRIISFEIDESKIPEIEKIAGAL